MSILGSLSQGGGREELVCGHGATPGECSRSLYPASMVLIFFSWWVASQTWFRRGTRVNRSVARAFEFLADMEEDYDLSELPALPFVLSARLMVSIYCQEFGSWGEQENRWDLPASGDDERVVVESNWASCQAARA